MDSCFSILEVDPVVLKVCFVCKEGLKSTKDFNFGLLLPALALVLTRKATSGSKNGLGGLERVPYEKVSGDNRQ